MAKSLKTNGAPYGSRTRLFRLKISREPQQYQYVVQSHSAEATQVIPMGYKASAKHGRQSFKLRITNNSRSSVPISERTLPTDEAACPNARSWPESTLGLLASPPAGILRVAEKGMKRPL